MSNLFRDTTLVRLLQFSNAPRPTLVTLLGIVTFLRLVQPKKAFAPILVTLLGMVTVARLVQAAKALSPMLVTLLGIVTLVRPSHFMHASRSMLVTGSPEMSLGITAGPIFPFHPVIVTLELLGLNLYAVGLSSLGLHDQRKPQRRISVVENAFIAVVLPRILKIGKGGFGFR